MILIALLVDLHCQHISGVCSGFLREPPPFFITQNVSITADVPRRFKLYRGSNRVRKFSSWHNELENL